MSTKPKTRFVIQASGSQLELFSVRVSSNGDLRVLPKSPRFAFFGDQAREIREQHISVHNSNDARDTCITLPQQFIDGGTVDYATFLKNTSRGLLWPLFSRRVGIVHRGDTTMRAKDTIVSLPAYNTSRATLFFTAYVSSPDIDLRNSFTDKASIHSSVCGRFVISIVANFLNLPTLEKGHLFGATTSLPTDRGKRGPGHIQIERSSMTIDEAIGHHWAGLTFLREEMLSIVWPLIAKTPKPDQELFINFASTFTCLPLGNEQTSEN